MGTNDLMFTGISRRLFDVFSNKSQSFELHIVAPVCQLLILLISLRITVLLIVYWRDLSRRFEINPVYPSCKLDKIALSYTQSHPSLPSPVIKSGLFLTKYVPTGKQ